MVKEINRFHALLVSNDSFFHLWVADYIRSSRYANYVVIGDLTREGIEQYWNEHLTYIYVAEFLHQILTMCTTFVAEMFLLMQYMWEYIISQGKVGPQEILWSHKNK